MQAAPTTRRPRVFYGWYIVGAAAATGFSNFAIFTLGQALFVKDISDEFAWSVTAISLGFSLRTFEQGVMAPIGGYLIDRFGARVMALTGSMFMFVGLVSFAFMQELWHFYLSSFTVALGQGLGANQAYFNPVVRWFNRKRGQAASWVAMGRGWSYMGILPVSLLLTHFGWRPAALVCAGVFIAIAVPCALILRDRPEPYGLLPDGDPAPPDGQTGGRKSAASDEGFTVKEALRTRAFWLVLAAMALYSYCTSTYQVHFLSHLRFSGFSASAAATIHMAHGILQVGSRIGVGWVGDRFGRVNTMRWAQVLLGVGWAVVAFITPATALLTLPLYYLFFGLGQAAYTVTSQTVVADYFGPRRFATIRGLMNPISVLGSVLGPIVAGLSKDHLGSFSPAYLSLAPLIWLGALALTLAGKPSMAGEERRVARA